MPKDKPEIRFAGYTDAWEKRRLNEIAEFNPKSTLPDVFEYVDLESVVGTKMINHRTETKINAPSRAQRVAKFGDVFYQTVRPYQKNNYLFKINGVKYVFSTGYAQLRPKYSSEFLLSRIQENMFVKKVLDRSTGTSYPAINSNDLAKIEITIPNSAEQQNIGRLFLILDNIIAVNQRKVDLLKELKKGFLQKMFPKNGEDKPEIRFSGFTDAWVQRKFADMFAKIGDGLHGTPQYDDNGDTAFINGNNLSNGNIVISDETKRVTEGQKSIADTSLTNQTILMSINGTIGSLAWYRGENVMLGKSVAYMIPDAVDSKFAYYELQTAKTMTHFKNALTGTTIKNLGLKAIRDRMLWVPKQDEQYRIGQLLYDLDNLIAANQRRVDLLKQEKKALLQKMFV